MALALTGVPANGGGWQATPLQPALDGTPFWRDGLGTTHQEAGTLFMGAAGAAITDSNGKFQGKDNVYVAGPALFPTLSSANPSLTALSLARRTANAIVSATTPTPRPAFAPLSLSPTDWQMVKQPGSPATMIHYGSVLETFSWYGLYWYMKQQARILRCALLKQRTISSSRLFVRSILSAETYIDTH